METREALFARFKELLVNHTQAEVARKTGHSLSNVNRYASGTRLPGDFLCDLVRGLGINPAWLLAGEGATYTADISAGTRQMAGNLLELVEAMNAVAQMKLGALTGKHHLRVLRELNDALVRYEALRARLNAQSRPILVQLLGDLERALRNFDLERVTELRKAADQVARLCDDEILAKRLIGLSSQAEFLARNVEGALSLQRKLALARLLSSDTLSDEDCEMIRRYCLTLRGQGRLKEALRVCSAVLELAHDRENSPALHDLAFLRGRILVGLGELREGLAQMQTHAPLLGPRRQSAAYPAILRALLLGGLIAPDAGFAFVPGAQEPGAVSAASTAEIMLEFACLRADVSLLRRALKFAEHLSPRTPREALPTLAWPRTLLAALENRAKKEDWDAVAKEMESRARATGLVPALESQFHLRRGDNNKARRCHESAQAYLDALPKHVTLDLLWLAIHHRNSLAILDARSKDPRAVALRAQSEQWLDEHVRRGYVAFAAT